MGILRRSAARALLGTVSLVGAVSLLASGTGASASSSATAPGRPVSAAGADGGARVAQALPLGLTSAERSALGRTGAFGAHPVRLLILGDSIAMTLGMGLSEGAHTSYGVAVADEATIGCDLDPQLQVVTSGTVGPATQGCVGWRTTWPLLMASQRPQVVALGLGRWEVSDHLLDGRWVHVGEPVWDAHLSADLEGAISIFHSFGAKVVLFTMPYIDPSARQPDGLPWPENSPDRTRAYNALLAQVARAQPSGEVTVVDLNKMLSPNGAYTPSVGGVRVRYTDGIHVSLAGGVLLQRQILPEVDRIGMEGETAAKAGA
ncbi:MAG: SGNH hydrolase domain-containing protein [Acidimicrobiales bacterium]